MHTAGSTAAAAGDNCIRYEFACGLLRKQYLTHASSTLGRKIYSSEGFLVGAAEARGGKKVPGSGHCPWAKELTILLVTEPTNGGYT